jgi:DUF4097 and DUF4098 domain-containing protein YvlB
MADPPLRLNVTTRRGKVKVTAAAGASLQIDGGAVTREHEGVQEIRRDPDAEQILITCPNGTDVTIGTISGDVATEGELGAVRIATVSGKVRVADATQVDARTKSGSIEIEECTGECRVVSTSAKVRIGHAGRAAIAGVSGVVEAEGLGGAEVKTVSGKVLLGVTGAGPVSVHTVSGKVEIRVPRDLQPATRLKSISGKIRCDCPSGTDGEIKVASVSGAIRVSCK